MSTEMAQMNTRISRSLKERGDAALEKAGMTPSQAVRKLWDFAARNSHNPQIIQSLFDTEDEAEKREAEEERARRRAVALKSANIVADAYERAGIEPSEWTKKRVVRRDARVRLDGTLAGARPRWLANDPPSSSTRTSGSTISSLIVREAKRRSTSSYSLSSTNSLFFTPLPS